MSLAELKEKLIQLEKNFDVTQKQVKKIMEEKQQITQVNHIYCYFNYSLILEHERNSRLILGSFHVKNASYQKKNKTTILMKVNEDDNFNFTVKFLTDSQRIVKCFDRK